MSVAIDLSGRTALVTGGGSGIGRAISERLAEAGAAVAIADIRKAAAHETAEGIEETGGRAVPIEVDVTDWDSCLQAVGQAGEIDILVNGAAVWTVEKFLELTPDDWRADIDVGLEGVLNMTRAVLPGMVERESGVVVNIASDAGRVGEPRLAVYSAVKAGVVGFTKAIAKEMGRFGIRINCIAPGTTRTPGAQDLIEMWGEDKMAKSYPLGRIGEPMDIANAVLFLACDLSSWMTGQVFSVSGGYSTAG